jgi:hypothetical protein
MTNPNQQPGYDQEPTVRTFNSVYVEAFAKTALCGSDPAAVVSNVETNHFVGEPYSKEYLFEPTPATATDTTLEVSTDQQ